MLFIICASENVIRRFSVVTHWKLLCPGKITEADRNSRDQTEQREKNCFVLIRAWYYLSSKSNSLFHFWEQLKNKLEIRASDMERPEEVSSEASFFIGEESKAQETHWWPLVEPCCAGTRIWLPALPLSCHMAEMKCCPDFLERQISIFETCKWKRMLRLGMITVRSSRSRKPKSQEAKDLSETSAKISCL